MNIWSGLLFLEGAVADPALARELAGDDAPAPSAETINDTGHAREAEGRDRSPIGAGLY